MSQFDVHVKQNILQELDRLTELLCLLRERRRWPCLYDAMPGASSGGCGRCGHGWYDAGRPRGCHRLILGEVGRNGR